MFSWNARRQILGDRCGTPAGRLPSRPDSRVCFNEIVVRLATGYTAAVLPLAAAETKQALKSPQAGQQQAELYAGCL